MTITLLAVSLNDSPLTQPITASFDARGGTIGRADHNTMALPDPERHISRLQAEVLANGPCYLIRNVGGANPIAVAGRQIARGESAPLRHDDEVRVGGYRLRVIDDAQADSSGVDITQGRARVHDALGQPPPPQATQSTPARDDVAAFNLAGLGAREAFVSNPFADLLGCDPAPSVGARPATTESAPVPATDPFAGLIAPPSGLPSDSRALSRGSEPPATALPDDFDLFAARPPAGNDAGATKIDPFADLMPSGGEPSIDVLYNLPSRSGGDDALARFAAPELPASGPRQEGGISTDPLALFGGGTSPDKPAAAPFSSHTPDRNAAFVPPRWVPQDDQDEFGDRTGLPPQAEGSPDIPADATWLRPRPSSRAAPVAAPVESATPPASQPTPEPASGFVQLQPQRRPAQAAALTPAPPIHPPPAASVPAALAVGPPPAAAAGLAAPTAIDDDILWRAFCEGARINLPRPDGLDAQTMRLLGELLHAAVAGTLQLIAVRASTKQELRADVTMIRPRENNPLKFSPDAQTGLEQLLNPPLRGFLPGPAAMTDAMNDLVGHSIGTMTGMRAALDGVLSRFAPTALQTKLSGASLLNSVLPMTRKAKLWDLYLQHFDSIRDEAQDDFHTLFGRAFLAAYEQQIERLKALPRQPE